MTDFASYIGRPITNSKVVVERGPVSNFAEVLKAKEDYFYDINEAKKLGLNGIPALPTFPFVMEHWGLFKEIQPEDKVTGNPMFEVLGPLMSNGGIILHGEQSFTFERPIVSGDVLEGKGTVVDCYQKESSGRTMTFVVTETVWTDVATNEKVATSRSNIIHRK
jgi:hypothetical protein